MATMFRNGRRQQKKNYVPETFRPGESHGNPEEDDNPEESSGDNLDEAMFSRLFIPLCVW